MTRARDTAAFLGTGLPSRSFEVRRTSVDPIALKGMSDVLAKEVAPFGLKVTAAAPDSFRTEWAGRSMVRSPRSIEEYDALFNPVRKASEEKSGKQNGDLDKAAAVILDLVTLDEPPAHAPASGRRRTYARQTKQPSANPARLTRAASDDVHIALRQKYGPELALKIGCPSIEHGGTRRKGLSAA